MGICFFCNNQFRILQEGSKEGSDDLEKTFANRLAAIGNVLVLFDDWKDPVYLTRVWCVFETYVADNAGVTLDVIFPAQVKESLICELQKGSLNRITQAWGCIDVEKAKASRSI